MDVRYYSACGRALLSAVFRRLSREAELRPVATSAFREDTITFAVAGTLEPRARHTAGTPW